MHFRTLIIVVFMIATATSDSILNLCTNTGTCIAASSSISTLTSSETCDISSDGCNLPLNYNDCMVNWQGVSYQCTNPPAGYYYVGITCNYMVGCPTCSATVLRDSQPICQWRT
jgi:hypothetical protein